MACRGPHGEACHRHVRGCIVPDHRRGGGNGPGACPTPTSTTRPPAASPTATAMPTRAGGARCTTSAGCARARRCGASAPAPAPSTGVTVRRVTRGWCHAHYQRWRRLGTVAADRPLRGDRADCQVPGCERAAQAQELCGTHYQRWRQHGDVQPEVPIGEMPREAPPRTSRGWVSNGYRYVPVEDDEAHLVGGARYAAEHRLVMARLLGRPLHDHENVHHRNGHRSGQPPRQPRALDHVAADRPPRERPRRGRRQDLAPYAPHLLAENA